MTRLKPLLLAALAAGLCGSAYPQPATPAPGTSQASTAAEMAEGEVRRVDKPGGRITLKHGEIKDLDMPPMTMVFGVASPAMLDTLKPGDKVRFRAAKQEGKYVVTEIRPDGP
jgi:Cu/Ag efflux protein CusF